MNPSGGFNADLSPSAVHTGIDAFIFEEYQRTQVPQYVSVRDDFWFKQGSTVGDAFIWEEYSNVGNFQAGENMEEILSTDIETGNQKTVISQRWTKQVPVSYEAFKADGKGVRANIGRDIGDRARQSQDQNGLVRVYGDAFAGSYNTTPDGDALASASHTTLTGINVDNLETGSLDADNLWTGATTLANQVAQDGDAGSYNMEGVLVPFTLYKTLKETTNSQLVPFSGENQINIFDTDYGTLRLGASIFLGSTFNGATNANTSYHLVSSKHQVMRKVFYDLATTLTSPENTSNHAYIMRALYNEIAFPGSWCGYVGSNGTT